MIDRLLNILGLGDGSLNGASEWRRRHVRHDIRESGVEAEVEINGRAYSLRDWSMGGLCFDADNMPEAGQDIDMNIRFRLPHETITIRQNGRVVRAMKKRIAAEFVQTTPDMQRRFRKVLDGMHALQFVESQVA
ncbi:MAG: PilZ domain-containing protein [Alphaproteobacteria bacterium]|nr:PilZ domain-containing protein [Alphaproteobacteria bacterium]HRI77250.1 PilZ domain-containing protein [Alphaproteobacteria bacterium]